MALFLTGAVMTMSLFGPSRSGKTGTAHADRVRLGADDIGSAGGPYPQPPIASQPPGGALSRPPCRTHEYAMKPALAPRSSARCRLEALGLGGVVRNLVPADRCG